MQNPKCGLVLGFAAWVLGFTSWVLGCVAWVLGFAAWAWFLSSPGLYENKQAFIKTVRADAQREQASFCKNMLAGILNMNKQAFVKARWWASVL